MANYNSAKQKAYDVILHLVDNFQNGIKSKNETETRRYYIDKFFEALGWDVGNEKGKREVIHEDIVKVKGKTKFPDYGFYFKGKRVFFVEAKDTKVDIKNDSRPAFQLRSYAWSAKLGVSILTDFEEFAVYDCTVRPKENDRTEAARIKYFTYEDYLKEGVFDYIYDLFERENVANGSLDAYSENLCNRKGSETVDVHFLSTLDELRTKLAVVISKLNREMSEKDINYAVQQIIDRIIFLRVAEDRNVENYGLLALANPKNKNEDDFKNYGFNGENSYYENLNYIFDRANEKYNSGLFDEDAIVRNLNIDDKTIKDIIDELYTPKNPYQFSVIPVEIIGNAYEQFLGKTISIDKNHKAVIELKPEVRKAGGVYYTPEYIVDYIVANTVGEAIKGKTPDEIVNIKILDPACGSGSFLLGAYKYLLNYHKEYFLKNKTKKYMGSRYEIIDESGNLALWVRKQILINNIFGVDIDSNAVEVAKLSLLLKSFEDSFNVNEYGQGSLLNEKILPSLENNIKSGNSLINSNFNSEGERLFASDEDTQYKIKCFSWEKEFSSVIKKGGFDIIIGNPPYVKEYTDRESFENVKKGNLAKYYQGKMDLWYFFVCFGLDILKENGKLGFIAPNNWITNAGASILRNKILTDSKILKYIDFGDFRVFLEAGIQTMVFILNKEKINEDYEIDYYKILNKNIDKENLIDFLYNGKINSDIKHIKSNISLNMKNNLISFVNDENINILDKIKNAGNFHLLDNEIGQGIVGAPDKCFIIDNINNFTDDEKKFIKPFFTGIERYKYELPSKYIIYLSDKNFKNEKLSNYKNLYEHFKPYKKLLEESKIKYKTPNKPYYYLHRERDENMFKSGNEKIISVGRTDKPKFVYTLEDFYGSRALFFITTKRIDLKYLIGILNSRLVYFWLYNKGKKQGDQLQVDKEPLLNIPICNTDNEQLKNKLINFVNEMIECNQRLINEKNPDSINRIKNDIADIDSFIDKTVYSIYNISEEERKIIEGE